MFMTEDRKPGILLVDDEPAVSKMVRIILSSLTPDIVVVESGDQAVEVCLTRAFDLVISDMKMPGMDGVELLHLLAHDYPSMRRIILTGHADLELTMNAINSGRVHRYLTKPWSKNALVDTVAEELTIGERERSEITRLRAVIDKLSEQ
jgi:response regulator RpfG family c-di-GMP phosphodiesterase